MKDSRLQPKLVGTVNLNTEELLSEECAGRINFPNGVGECSIYVYSKEGTIPHFHIIANNKKGECCICIYEPLYFNHGNKQLKLNSKQRKILNDWLSSPSNYNKPITNWDVIDLFWRGGNGGKYVPKDSHQPDYRYMENMRS